MNRNIILTLWMAAALPLLLTSCQQEELPDMNGASDTTPLTITVTDGGYASTDKAATRAAENGYRTEFTDGDACGLYIVRGGTVVYGNVKLTATAGTDGSLTWQPSAGVTLGGGLPGEKYFLYYPYQSAMSGKTDASVTDADGFFFAPLIRDWTPKADQSTYAAYTASDLMTATGTASKDGKRLVLSFSMTHRMALAVIEMPKAVYKFTDNTDIPDCTVATAADFTDSDTKPCRMVDGTYRCIVNPTSSTPTNIIGSYADGTKEFAITPNGITDSSYKTYKIDGAPQTEKQATLQIGDYFCKGSDDNWYIIPQEATPYGNVIGIVFCVGQHSSDGADYSTTGIGQAQCHGYVVALTDVGNYPWAFKDGAYGQDARTSTSEYDWNGYSNQKAIENFAGNNTDGWKFEHFEAAYRCSIYGTEKGKDWQRQYAAPVNTSGWFLPSCNQLTTLFYLNRDNANLLATSMENVKSQDSSHICWFEGYYWSSTERLHDPYLAWYVSFYNGSGGHNVKPSADGVRAILAF